MSSCKTTIMQQQNWKEIKMSDTRGKLKQLLEQAWAWYKATVAKYPVKSPLVALVIGVAIGWLVT